MAMYKRFKWNPLLIAGVLLVGAISIIALVSLFYTPYDPNKMDMANKLSAPSLTHLFGTDQFGRDVLSRIMVGANLVFIIGIGSVMISLLIGILLGALSGFYGKALDAIIMKFVEVQMAFPGVLLALMLISIFTSHLGILIVAIALMNTPRFTRIVRSGFLQYKNAMFVEAARAIGLTPLRIMVVHILPNLLPDLFITAALSFATAILSEAGLSYLGLGVNPPFASWGKMLNEAQLYMIQAPLLALLPGSFITLVVLGFNFIADGLRKLLND
jgi:peptide/nickel transport system permease protein